MRRFDLRDRNPTVPAQTTLHPDGRERVFELPYDTDDPEDLKLLRKHPLLVESEVPVPIPKPPDLEDKPAKTPRKEVVDE